MLRIPAVIAVLGLSALTLAACASAPGSAACDRVDSDSSIFDVVHSSGEFGTPETTLDAPVNVDATTVRDETAGDGLRVTSDDQDVFFSVYVPRFQVVIPDFGIVEGRFQITALEYSGSHNGEASYELTLASAGQLTFTAL